MVEAVVGRILLLVWFGQPRVIFTFNGVEMTVQSGDKQRDLITHLKTELDRLGKPHIYEGAREEEEAE